MGLGKLAGRNVFLWANCLNIVMSPLGKLIGWFKWQVKMYSTKSIQLVKHCEQSVFWAYNYLVMLLCLITIIDVLQNHTKRSNCVLAKEWQIESVRKAQERTRKWPRLLASFSRKYQ